METRLALPVIKAIEMKTTKPIQNHLHRHRDLVLTLVILLVIVLIYLIPSSFVSPYAQDVERVRTRVIAVDDRDIQQYGIVKAGSQALEVEILEGQYQGVITSATNDLIGKMETDKMFSTGDTAFVVLNVLNGEVLSATAYDHYRIDIELILIGIFVLVLVGFAGWSGARAVVSFIFAISMIWRVLLPSILLGYDPLWMAFVVVLFISAVTLFLVAGINRSALVALLGASLGILVAIALALAIFPFFHLHGAVQPFSETLLYSGYEFLDLTRIFLAAVFVGASGAVIDVAIDVSTAMNEVIEKRPDLTMKELLQSGFVVGRNMTSTMVTTLLMAYAAGYMSLLMVFLAQGIPPVNILNTNYVAAEILRTVVGSFGLVTVAPFTALVGALIYTRLPERREGEEPQFHPVEAAVDAD